MAIDISPLYETVQTHIPCEVYDGHLGFVPLDYSQLCVVFTLTGANRVSSPTIERKEGNSDKYVTEVWSRIVEYQYQIDIMRQMTVDPQHESQTPPFEMEAFTVIDSINQARTRITKEYGLAVLPLSGIDFSLNTVAANTTIHRASCTFSILAESLVKFSSNTRRLACIKPQLTKLRK